MSRNPTVRRGLAVLLLAAVVPLAACTSKAKADEGPAPRPLSPRPRRRSTRPAGCTCG
ncbi:MAG: hypothetical protein R2731_03345 [Nocardioides sp.]